MKCSDLMTYEVEYCRANDRIESVAERMRDMAIGFLPVCGPDGAVVGTITDRDIVVRVVAERRNLTTTHVSDVMTRDLVACSPDDDIQVAEDLMAHYRKSRIVCLDEERRPAGVISLSAIALIAGAERTAHLLGAISARETEVRA